ncbi:MAG: bifunctional folylpolyglutamate synthase/dihydrofolate synthase [Acaryochloridaceae cyanobacterium CSU_3_4]|nr:bifunctional folylpolyglutamate synthase/dihydrofolate synthase [Acaryochloridaceae cyanobacterium CSU_3_4]
MFASLIGRYERFGIHLGLERVQSLLDLLGQPHRRVPVIHVAGTNGKGSVCAYLSSVLTMAGYRVGRYTSPHLTDWTERICINEQPIDPETLIQALLDLESLLTPTQGVPTQFEVLTALAWQYFAQQQVDIAVIEVGLGGRLDATNVCDQSLVSVITSISRDHWQRLGPTLADIAQEKAGVCKPHCPVVVGPLPPEAKAVVQAKIEELQCPAQWTQPARRIDRPAMATAGLSLDWAAAEGLVFPLRLLGEMQLTNGAVAIAVLQTLRVQGWRISDTAIQEGMANTHWPGRLQWVHWQQQPLLIDGAHNTAAALALRQYIDSLHPSSVHWLMGMLSSKDHGDILQILLRSGDTLSLMPVPDHSSADERTLAKLARTICPGLARCQCFPSLALALEDAVTLSEQPAPLRVLCGSLYLVGQYLKTYPPTV